MAPWTRFPYDARPFLRDIDTLKSLWPLLHAGDAQPWPEHAELQAAWALYHAGELQAATQAGLSLGAEGIVLANKAQTVYANYLEPDAGQRLAMWLEVAERARQLCRLHPDNPNAWFGKAYALGRYSQGISVTKALKLGLGTQIRTSLETVLRLQPLHADACFALGTFHAELVDALGKLLGRAEGADAEIGRQMFLRGLQLHPRSIVGRVEFARGLVMLQGSAGQAQADQLYAQAIQTEPLDARECLDQAMARAEWAD